METGTCTCEAASGGAGKMRLPCDPYMAAVKMEIGRSDRARSPEAFPVDGMMRPAAMNGEKKTIKIRRPPVDKLKHPARLHPKKAVGSPVRILYRPDYILQKRQHFRSLTEREQRCPGIDKIECNKCLLIRPFGIDLQKIGSFIEYLGFRLSAAVKGNLAPYPQPGAVAPHVRYLDLRVRH